MHFTCFADCLKEASEKGNEEQVTNILKILLKVLSIDVNIFSRGFFLCFYLKTTVESTKNTHIHACME